MDLQYIQENFNKINKKYKECNFQFKENLLYFENTFRTRAFGVIISKIYVVLCFICLAFNPKNGPVYPNAFLKTIGDSTFILFLCFSLLLFIFLLLSTFIKVNNVIDLSNNCLSIEIWILKKRVYSLFKIDKEKILIIGNKVVPLLLNPAGKQDNIKGVPVEVNEQTNMFLENGVYLLLKDGKTIDLWSGFTTESYNNVLEIIENIADLWNLKKINCNNTDKISITYRSENDYFIEFKPIERQNRVGKLLLYLFISFLVTIASVSFSFLIGIR